MFSKFEVSCLKFFLFVFFFLRKDIDYLKFVEEKIILKIVEEKVQFNYFDDSFEEEFEVEGDLFEELERILIFDFNLFL